MGGRGTKGERKDYKKGLRDRGNQIKQRHEMEREEKWRVGVEKRHKGQQERRGAERLGGIDREVDKTDVDRQKGKGKERGKRRESVGLSECLLV